MILFNHYCWKIVFAPRYIYALSFHVCPQCILLFLTTGVSLRYNKKQEGVYKVIFSVAAGGLANCFWFEVSYFRFACNSWLSWRLAIASE